MTRLLSTRAVALGAVVLGTLLGAITACPNPRAEGLIVNVQTDFVPRVEFDAVRVQVDASNTRSVSVGASENFGRSHLVTTYTALPPGRHALSVTLLRAGTALVTRTITVEFQSSYLANVVLTRACAGRVCAAEESCLGNRCVASTCVTGTEPSCPMPECRSDDACSTSTACVDVTCVSSVCLQTPNDARCPADHVCVPGLGCTPVGSEDADFPDAAASDDDATTDEDAFVCAEGESRPCTTGCGSTAMQACAGNAWTQCTQAELCNAQDDDCDGTVDGPGLCGGSESCVRGTCVPCGILFSGDALLPGELRYACDGVTHLAHQTDGNVATYIPGGTRFSTATELMSTTAFTMQTDGNLVLTDGATVRWQSATHGHDGAFLFIRDDGVIELREADGTAFWTGG